ncbi:MAG: DNA polymerase III subunit gamma/tau [bacterium]|nr:DNA polymerase III subunit gamma/tau [bacterium]
MRLRFQGMGYQALYRKYRPQRFDQVIGQEHVTETLAKEIAEGRVAHAYLFSGPRGTGKTTTARLLAMALNCAGRGEADTEPCGACSSCSDVAASISMDVLELDAASHNKVDDIRDLRSGVSTVASTGGAQRVFILDEAHMLTKAACNALLKTLEEPPEHVHFVLATTEPYRLLDTVRSRSQRFDFHLVPTDILVKHLQAISEAEGFEATEDGLLAVARRATGSVRDALSLLEQVAARDGAITESGVQSALGVAGPESLMKLADAIAREDPAPALEMVARLSAQGVDLRRFVGDALDFFRGVFLTIYSSNVEEITHQPPDVIERWREVAGRVPVALVMRSIDLFGETLGRLREGREERMMLELAVLKLSRPELDDRSEALLRRIEKLERGMVAQPSSPPLAPAAEPPTVSSVPAGDPEPPPTGNDFQSLWPRLVNQVIEQIGSRQQAQFRELVPLGVEESVLVLSVPNRFSLMSLQPDRELSVLIARHAGALLGREVTVEYRLADEASAEEPDQPEPPGEEKSEPAPAPPQESEAEVEPPEATDPGPAVQADGATAIKQAAFLLENHFNTREVPAD